MLKAKLLQPSCWYMQVKPKNTIALSHLKHTTLKDWMNFRSSYGENIAGESWVMRDIWQATNIIYGANLGLATCPIKLKSSGIKRLLDRALWEQGLRHPLSKGVRRHEWKAAHGFRKLQITCRASDETNQCRNNDGS